MNYRYTLFALLPFLGGWWWGYIPEEEVKPIADQAMSVEACVEALASSDAQLILVDLSEKARPKLSGEIQTKIAKIQATCHVSDDRLALVQKTFGVEQIAKVVKDRREAAQKVVDNRPWGENGIFTQIMLFLCVGGASVLIALYAHLMSRKR